MKVIYFSEVRTVDKIDFEDGTLRILLDGGGFIWVSPDDITPIDIDIHY
ncbi:hypothetical protein P9Z80_33325 [Bacillus cereus]|nr:hypothetical protein [Bacillus cereus]MEC3262779.1 hypothetical protein [Bacillus cereus]